MKKIVSLFAGMLLAIGIAVGSAAPASAGNGTSNYYLSGSCKAGTALGGLYLNATNWDYGPNQYYHLKVTRSGVAYQVSGVYIDGRYLGKSLGDYQPWDGGHGRSYLYLTGYLSGLGTKYSCGFYL